MKKITALCGLVSLFMFFSCQKESVVPVSSTKSTLTTTGNDTTTTPIVGTTTGTTIAPAKGTTTGTTIGTTTGTTTAPAKGTTTGTSTTGTTTGTTTGGSKTPPPPTSLTPSNLTGVYGDGVHDDTKALQTLLNAGSVTLAAGKTYVITGLGVGVYHTFNLNGSTLSLTSSSGIGTRLEASGATVTNGSIIGKWNNATSGNTAGVAAVSVDASNCTISNINISSVSAYGIVAGANTNNLSITHCTISNTGYLGFYYDPETAASSGGVFSYNTVDRSMVPASTIMESAVAIRGSSSVGGPVTSNWTIDNNVFKMPVNPASLDAECIEVRNMANSTLANNVFTGSSIACSVVQSSTITVSSNSTSGTSVEGIEYADSHSCIGQSNIVTNSNYIGELIDGSVGSTNIQISGDKISGTVSDCIEAYKNTQNLTVANCTLSIAKGGKGLDLISTNQVTVSNTIFNGNSLGSMAIMEDTCPGNLTVTGGSISNLKNCILGIYSETSGLTTNNISVTGVTVTGVPYALSTTVASGAVLGANINVQL